MACQAAWLGARVEWPVETETNKTRVGLTIYSSPLPSIARSGIWDQEGARGVAVAADAGKGCRGVLGRMPDAGDDQARLAQSRSSHRDLYTPGIRTGGLVASLAARVRQQIRCRDLQTAIASGTAAARFPQLHGRRPDIVLSADGYVVSGFGRHGAGVGKLLPGACLAIDNQQPQSSLKTLDMRSGDPKGRYLHIRRPGQARAHRFRQHGMAPWCCCCMDAAVGALVQHGSW